jgi:Zn-dependent metalloprotease
MTYGDGSGTYFDVLTSIDVGSRIGHAVCEKTANLAYQKRIRSNE